MYLQGTFPPGVVEVSKSINRVQKYPIKYGVCDSGELGTSRDWSELLLSVTDTPHVHLK